MSLLSQTILNKMGDKVWYTLECAYIPTESLRERPHWFSVILQQDIDVATHLQPSDSGLEQSLLVLKSSLMMTTI